MNLTFLHTNDLHGKLTKAKAKRIQKLRREADFYADSGDCVSVGNINIPLKIDSVWNLLHEAGCDVGVIGNRETHPSKKGFEAKLRGVKHPLVCANLYPKGKKTPVLPPYHIFEHKGHRIGFFGVMVPMVTTDMWSSSFSHYLWDSPLETAKSVVMKLRPKVDLLIALTHIGFTQDQLLAHKCPEIDLIFGGHSHDKLEEPLKVGDVWIFQTGSHGKYVGRYVWEHGKGLASGELIALE